MGPPRSEGAKATPIGRKREFISAAAAMAAPAPPPWARIATALNCADPANTIADITTASSFDSPASCATTPNETDRSSPAAANGRPARTPSRKVDSRDSGAGGEVSSRRSSCPTRHSRSSAT